MNQRKEDSGKQEFPGFYCPCPQNISTLQCLSRFLVTEAVSLKKDRGRYGVASKSLAHSWVIRQTPIRMRVM